MTADRRLVEDHVIIILIAEIKKNVLIFQVEGQEPLTYLGLCCSVIVNIVNIKDSCDQQSCFRSVDNIAPVGFCHFVKEVK